MSQGKPQPIPLARIFSGVNYRHLHFVILDCPSNDTLPIYLEEMKKRRVTDVVRVCEPNYDKSLLLDNDIQVHDWPFKDGGLPPPKLVQDWLALVESRFGSLEAPKNTPESDPPGPNDNVIAVHCVAGLGRAPCLVAISLIEAGMSPLDAVEYVRRFRRGAFNSVQINYLDSYKRGQYTSFKKRLGLASARSNSPSPGTPDSWFGRVFKFGKGTSPTPSDQG